MKLVNESMKHCSFYHVFEASYLPGVPHGMVIGQMHELVDQVRLVQLIGNGAQLLVGGQSAPVTQAQTSIDK